MMIEMDRFVVTLQGTREEEVTRSSRDTSSTMKLENEMTVNKMSRIIEDMLGSGQGGDIKGTFCGLPHHLYLPRSAIRVLR